eukprot:946638-Amphidinium_carterae.1
MRVKAVGCYFAVSTRRCSECPMRALLFHAIDCPPPPYYLQTSGEPASSAVRPAVPQVHRFVSHHGCSSSNWR